MRKIKGIHEAIYAPIDDLITYRAMPTQSIGYIDPFLFLNHHGPQVYPINNNGLPFGPHPHRGFETLTFILDGDLTHIDSGTGTSIIRAGGIQWMTAGKGLVHAEISSDEFKREGGNTELIQLWFNLPSHLKMTDPGYTGLQEEDIPVVWLDNKKVKLHVVSGEWNHIKGPVNSITGIEIVNMELQKGGKYEIQLPPERNILFYVENGKVNVNSEEALTHHLVEFENNEGKIEIQALENSRILLGHGLPFNEPIVAQGPFVMNFEAEIKQAWLDYQQGKMGSLTL